MKWFVGFAVILFLLCAAALGYVVYVFDPNPLRPQIEKALLEQYGLQTRIGYLSITWGGELRINVDGLILRNAKDRQLLLKTDKASVGILLKDLLRKQLHFRSLNIENPQIYLRKLNATDWNWTARAIPSSPLPVLSEGGMIPSAYAASPTGEMSWVTEGWMFLIQEIHLNHGQLFYRDETNAQKPFEFHVEGVDAEVNLENRQKYRLKAQAQLFDKNRADFYAVADYDTVHEVLNLHLDYGKGIVEMKGRVENLIKHPNFKGTVEIHQLDLESVTPEDLKKYEYVAGSLTGHFDGQFIGNHPTQILTTLKLKGYIDARQGAIKNVNFIRNAVENLTPVPALTVSLLRQTPEKFKPLFENPDTPFDHLKTSLRVDSGNLTVESLELKHTHFLLSSQGDFDLLKQHINLKGQLILLESLAEYLVTKVHELQGLTNQDGRMVLPFRFSGVLPGQARFIPDFKYVTTQIIQTQGQELLQKGLNRLSELLGEEQ